MGLNARLLAGLAVLVLLAISSTGWLTLEVARARLVAVEEERARATGEAAAALLGGLREGFSEPGRARLSEAARRLVGVGGVEEVAIVDAMQHPLVGQPAGDAALAAAMGGGAAFTRRTGETVTVYAPIRGGEGGVLGAVRLR